MKEGANIYYNSGNVGIGTIGTPSYSLDVISRTVAGAGVTSFALRISAYQAVTNLGNNTSTLIGLATEIGTSGRVKCALGHCRTGAYDIGSIVFLCNNAQDETSVTMSDERMRITSTGNVGIGTNNPIQSLHIHNNTTSADVRMIISDNTSTANNLRGFHIIKFSDNNAYICNYENTSLIFCSGTNGPERMRITSTGNVGIGTNAPGFRLEVSGSTSAGTMFATYFGYNNYIPNHGGLYDLICAKFNGAIWTTQYLAVSSDIRIKEDIQDIIDDTALKSILTIEPKTYKYIDKLQRGDKKVYGFIAQQIREVIPEAVSIQASYIPNIYLVADYIENVITLSSQPTKVIIKMNDKIKCYDKDNKEILIEVIEVIDDLTFRIKEIEYTDTKIFVYGTFVDDFHTLNKDYIFTLNVCATQELHRRIETQGVLLKSQDDRIKDLETKVAMLLNSNA